MIQQPSRAAIWSFWHSAPMVPCTLVEDYLEILDHGLSRTQCVNCQSLMFVSYVFFQCNPVKLKARTAPVLVVGGGAPVRCFFQDLCRVWRSSCIDRISFSMLLGNVSDLLCWRDMVDWLVNCTCIAYSHWAILWFCVGLTSPYGNHTCSANANPESYHHSTFH